LELNRGEIVHSRSLILAMGVRRRRLNISGESEFTGKGILTSGAKEKHSVAGKHVVIVGGGDAALENAHILSEFAERVYVVHRRSEFRARPEFVSEARHNRLIALIYDSVLSSIDGDASVRSVTIQNLKTHAQRVIPADAVLIRIGVQPNSELVQGQLELDRSGYVKTDHLCQTSQANVFAVGDIANPTSPTIATAAGNGATAIKAAAPLLNNSGDL
ncbi:MAG TPA: FAD-dependent oxidoreductase, partial [Pyrinomonadaceae bacterium]|nr:FAD-dependent oxidoreductase [Pyrinomonadaceae bacterium]